MSKVFCSRCRFFSSAVVGGNDWFIVTSCESPENRFTETTHYSEYTKRKKPVELNGENECKFYKEATEEAIYASSKGFSGPYEYENGR